MAKSKYVDLKVTGTVVGKFKADHLIKIPRKMQAQALDLGQEFLIKQYGQKTYDEMVDVSVVLSKPEKKKK